MQTQPKCSPADDGFPRFYLTAPVYGKRWVVTGVMPTVHHVGPGLDSSAYELMADRHGHWDGRLGPLVPLVGVHVGAATSG